MSVGSLTLSEVDNLQRFKHERRVGNEEQILAIFRIGDSGIDDRNSCHTGDHKQVQCIDLIEGIKPGMLRRVADVIRIGHAGETVAATN